MPKTILMLIIGLFFGTGLGFLVAASSGAKLEGHNHGSAAHDHSAHDHGQHNMDHSKLVEVAGAHPELTLVVHPDGPQSRNLELKTANFEFDPLAVNGAHVDGSGHAHIYVNGIKLARAYAPWVHLQALPKGENHIRVTLNANDHSHLAVDGAPIEANVIVVIE